MIGNALNLGLRFILELTALVIMGMWGWQLSDSLMRFPLAVALPLLAAAVWGIFAVPGDPSRSGKAPIPISGALRLILELAFFGFALFCSFNMDYSVPFLIYAGVLVLHYLFSLKRIQWLLKVR